MSEETKTRTMRKAKTTAREIVSTVSKWLLSTAEVGGCLVIVFTTVTMLLGFVITSGEDADTLFC